MKIYSFEKLEVWQIGRDITKDIYEITRDFPDDEKFGLTSQIRRACISITSNIAEGSSRNSEKEQARYTEIAFGSLLEVLNQLIVAHDLGYIKEEFLTKERALLEELGNKLNKLHAAQLRKNQ